MANWTNMTTVSDGQVLSASFLNTLSENIRYLWERAQQVNVPRETESISPGDGAEAQEDFAIVHKFNNVEYRIPMTQGTFDDFGIYYYLNGAIVATVYATGDDFSTPHVYEGVADISAAGLTIGQVYTIRVKAGGEPGSGVNSANIEILQEIP